MRYVPKTKAGFFVRRLSDGAYLKDSARQRGAYDFYKSRPGIKARLGAKVFDRATVRRVVKYLRNTGHDVKAIPAGKNMVTA